MNEKPTPLRLARQDEIVERIARELCSQNDIDPDALEPGNCPYDDNEEVVDRLVRREPHFYKWRLFRNQAAAALDALLDAAVRLETTKQGVLLGTEKQWVACTLTEENRLGAPDVLILRLGARTDDA